MFQNSDIISLNETHLGHRDTLTPDMMSISKDMLIVHCDCNNRGGGVHTIWEIVAVKISEPIQMILCQFTGPHQHQLISL